MKNAMALILWVATMALLIGMHAPADGEGTLSNEVGKIGEAYVSKKKNHSLVIGTLQGEKSEVLSFGQLSQSASAASDESTVYQIGELSELLTCAMLVDVASEGVLKIDDPVQNYYSGDEEISFPIYQNMKCVQRTAPMPYGYHQEMVVHTVCFPDLSSPELHVSLCNLASHAASLPPSLEGFRSTRPLGKMKNKINAYDQYTFEHISEAVSMYELTLPPATEYVYSGVGMGLLGGALSNFTETAFADLFQQRIGDRLLMKQTTFTRSSVPDGILAPGHNKKGEPAVREAFHALTPAVGGYSSVGDLLLFLKANLGLDQPEMSPVLEECHIPKITISTKEQTGMGWKIMAPDKKRSQTVIWRGSHINGYSAYIGFVKESGTGVVVLSNSANSVDEIGHTILALLNN